MDKANTDLLQTNQELTRKLERLQYSLEATGLGLWELNYRRRVLKADEVTYRIHGLDPTQAIDENKTFDSFVSRVHPDDIQGILEKLEENAQAFKDFAFQYRVVLPDGQIRFLKAFGRRDGAADEKEHIYFGAAWDCSDEVATDQVLKEQKAKMLASTKMAALGEMSGGIAHEINNPLTVIQARAFQLNQMADAQKLETTKVKQVADSISKTADKIAKIVRSLRAFSRDGTGDPFHLFSVHQVIEETLEFCKTRFYDNGVEISVHDAPEDLEFECRIIQIQQVLINLLNNSFDAIQDLDEKWIRLYVEDHEDTVEIQVVDSGHGIKPEIANQMMQPFYTTKDVGKGTGLGLSISRDIMKMHKGELVYDPSSPHTKFIIRLPKFQQPPA